MIPAVISASSVMCAAGAGGAQVWASVRSRISRIERSNIMGRDFEPLSMGLVPEPALDTDGADADLLTWPPRARRMLRLAVPPLREIGPQAGTQPLRVYLGLPQVAEDSAWPESFSRHLCARADLVLDELASQTFPRGRAAGLLALEAALNAIGHDPSRPVVVGGVDTFLDLRLLAQLGAEGRVLGPRVMDGFIPGEGAAFLLLESGTKAAPASVTIQAAASSEDPGNRYGTAPGRGEGLAQALTRLRSALPASLEPIRATFAGLNGESLDAKLWGVAQLRHGDLFDSAMTLEHPASCFGDTGAASGVILTVVAATAVAARHRLGPALVWAASDSAERGCAIVDASSITQ
jgi:3-oxoacyl-[acyl-carrier-protein] synthase I